MVQTQALRSGLQLVAIQSKREGKWKEANRKKEKGERERVRVKDERDKHKNRESEIDTKRQRDESIRDR